MRLEGLRVLARIVARHALTHPDHDAKGSAEHATASPQKTGPPDDPAA